MACSQCWQVENDTYVYRCSRCGGCYVCEHVVDLERLRWKCKDGKWRPVIFDHGVAVTVNRLTGAMS